MYFWKLYWDICGVAGVKWSNRLKPKELLARSDHELLVRFDHKFLRSDHKILNRSDHVPSYFLGQWSYWKKFIVYEGCLEIIDIFPLTP